jgi:hypothetical protein
MDDPFVYERAFIHFLEDPQYFSNLFVNPEAWQNSDEVAYLDAFFRHSKFDMSFDDYMLLGFPEDVAANLWSAHFLNGIGDSEGSEYFLAAAGAVPVTDLISLAKAQYPRLADRMQWHHFTPQYLGGSAWGYGRSIKPNAEELQRILNSVYQNYPIPSGSRSR